MKTPGQLAYEEDLRRHPTYPWSGRARPSWAELTDHVRLVWELLAQRDGLAPQGTP